MLFLAFASRQALAQTPSPLQEWQYSGGIALYKLFIPNTPLWQIETGAAFERRPLYEGSGRFRDIGGPVIDVRYKDIAFLSVGEGIGWNFLRGDHYRVGVAIGYDLGRPARDDLGHLKGLGDVSSAPVGKLFGSYVLSKEFPLVIRGDVRQFAGGANGAVGDIGAYMPLPGSSERFIMFAGPSVTLADRLYTQTLFGVSPSQALASGYPDYAAHGGLEAAGFGFTATRFIATHWLINADLAANRILGSAAHSPIARDRTPRSFVVSFAYRW